MGKRTLHIGTFLQRQHVSNVSLAGMFPMCGDSSTHFWKLFFLRSIVSFTPLPNVLNRWAGVSARLQPAAAIVVLGGGMEGDGALSTSSLRRTIHGITLFQ